jgi:hypothetical protein
VPCGSDLRSGYNPRPGKAMVGVAVLLVLVQAPTPVRSGRDIRVDTGIAISTSPTP